jgi:LysM repeat protein
MPLRPSSTSTAAALCGAGYVLVRFVPAPVTLVRHLRHPYSWIAQDGPDATVVSIVGALLWMCALWVVIGLAAIYLSTLPGLTGRYGRAVARRVLPAAIRHLVLASAGASLLLSPLSAAAAGSPSGAAVPSGTAVPSRTAVPSGTAPSWPVDQALPVPTTPAPSWPVNQAGAPAGTVTVASGDSLWTIAATNLGPAATDREIAVSWPYWYRANRSVIGRDPGLIQPGTELSVPTGPAAHPGS